MKLKELSIGGLISKLPIIQGGMGIGISLSNLAGAVACEGGVGVISAAQPGYNKPGFESNPLKTNLEALAKHISLAKEKAFGGLIGVNIMCASNKYDEYVKCVVDSKADLIISGAGLPINLPDLVKNSATKIAPIISSVKAAKVLLKLWDKRFEKTADMVVVEGPKAGGHLGFTPEALAEEASGEKNFDDELTDIIEFIKTYEDKYNRNIPVVFAGGVFDREDIKHYMDMGCSGVQIATRFVVTDECDASTEFKQAYINSTKESIGIVKSPVGMPGRALINNFIERTKRGNEPIKKCYSCLYHCDKKTIPYCISGALINAAKGDVDNGLVFCGESAYRLNKMTTVKELMKELTSGTTV